MKDNNDINPRDNGAAHRAWAAETAFLFYQGRQKARLDSAIGKDALFLPFLGEFGHRVQYHTRLVHFLNSPKSVTICCKKGQEVLYPSATSFYYDWQDIDDIDKKGTDRNERQWPEIEAKFPNYTYISSGCLGFDEEKVLVFPQETIHFKPKLRGLAADVCIGVRKRDMLPQKNWPHNQLVADALVKAGYTVAVIGEKGTSDTLIGANHFSGEYDTDAAIELLQNCKLFFAQDSGTCHLAAACQTNMVVLEVPDIILQRETQPVRSFFDCMQEINHGGKMARITSNHWNDPQFVVDTVLRVAEGIIGPKTAEVIVPDFIPTADFEAKLAEMEPKREVITGIVKPKRGRPKKEAI